jgi:hypothetical protein
MCGSKLQTNARSISKPQPPYIETSNKGRTRETPLVIGPRIRHGIILESIFLIYNTGTKVRFNPACSLLLRKDFGELVSLGAAWKYFVSQLRNFRKYGIGMNLVKIRR